MDRNEEKILEGVMARFLDDLGRVHFNQHQVGWGRFWNQPYSSMLWGHINITVEDCLDEDGNKEGYRYMTISFDGTDVSTFIDSKREFCHAHYPKGWTLYQFVDWAKKLFGQIN